MYSVKAIVQPETGLVICFVTIKTHAIFKVIVLHHLKHIIINITIIIHIRFHSPTTQSTPFFLGGGLLPIIFKRCQQRMPKEESRLISTHVPVRLTASIDHLSAFHLLSTLCSLGLIDKVRITPVVCVDLSIMNGSPGEGGRLLLELVRKVFFVQKHIWIIEFFIEPIFQLTHRMANTVQIRVSCQDHKGRPHLLPLTRRGHFEKGGQDGKQGEKENESKAQDRSSFDHGKDKRERKRILVSSSFIMHLKNLSPLRYFNFT